MTLRPLDDRVLVEFTDVAVSKTTRGGLFVPDNAKVYKHRQMRKGRVIAIGEKINPKLHGVDVGDDVCFLNQSGNEVPNWPGYDHAEGALRMLKADDILAVGSPDADIEGRHVEPEDDWKWYQKKFTEPHAPSDDDAPETD